MIEERDVRTAVRLALARRNTNAAQLAEQLGTHRSTLSRVLSESQPINSRSLWPRILETLDIEVVFRIKP